MSRVAARRETVMGRLNAALWADEGDEVKIDEPNDRDDVISVCIHVGGEMMFVYCRTADQVRALVPGFVSKAEAAVSA